MFITSRGIVDRIFSVVRPHPDVATLLLLYIGTYSALIVAGHGVPYVMDNNETFSSLNHAYNLWHFDFFRSMGLADEATSPYAAAHPVTHTHQGNFPRLFSFVLYALGARTPESQIWITTLTVGSASTVMAYVFFRRLAGRLFAWIAITLLMSNYLLIAQWQVNTYRVWHSFLLFGAFLCVHGIKEWPLWRWLVSTISIFAALFYGELVFAAFVAVSVALYAAWIYRLNARLILGTWIAQALGAGVALSILVTQLVSHLGWQVFVMDIQLTFFSRNLATDLTNLLKLVTDFYGTHSIVFFYNFNPTNKFWWTRSTVSTLEYQLSYFTFIVVASSLFLVLAVYLAPLRYPPKPDDPSRSHLFLVDIAVLIPGLFLLLLTGFHPSGNSLLATGVSAGIASALAYLIQWLSVRTSLSETIPSTARSALAGLALFAYASNVAMQGDFEFSDPVVPALLPQALIKAAILLSAVLGCLLILCGKISLLGKWAQVPFRLGPFLLCGMIAYAAVFHISGGYLISGYLSRLCPFFVFHLTAVLALGVFIPVAIVLRGAQQWKSQRGGLRVTAASACALAAAVMAEWSAFQLATYRLLPPREFSFANIIRRDLPTNDGIVTNAYAAPFGLYGQTWSYSDVSFWSKIVGSESLIETKKLPYIWLADRDANPAYGRPRFYICFSPIAEAHDLAQLKSPMSKGGKRCMEEVRQYRRLESGRTSTMQLLGYDTAHGRWAIFQLNEVSRQVEVGHDSND